MSQCADTCADGVWTGAETPLECAVPSRCPELGCFWRRFHALPADKYRRKEESQGKLEL
jgi:hypothetical protein